MGVIKVSHLKPDMLVSSDVKDRNGRLLVAAGTRLADKHIRIIKIWGVVEADIENASEEDVEPSTEGVVDLDISRAADEVVAKNFHYNDLENSAIAELYKISLRRKAVEMAGSGPAGGAPSLTAPAGRSSRKGREGYDARSPEYRDKPFDHIRQLIRNDVKLTTLPAIFRRINEMIMKPSSSSRDIAELISKDTSLAARLLKLVNSSFYGYPARIESLSRAVSIVGTNQVRMLAFGIDVVAQFKNIPSDYIDMDSFWRHSIACGIISRLIAATRNIQHTERLFIAGMLHDIGRLVVYHYTPHYALEILKNARQAEALLYRVEGEYLGADHTAIGGLLLQNWRLPQSLENAVRYHHTPCESQNGLEPAIVHVADVMAKSLGIGSSGDHYVPPLVPEAWTQVGLSVNALDSIADQTDRQLEETFQLFFK
jgi:HD-like signal output (HDOD) protein